MIREGKKLPADVAERLPELGRLVSDDEEVLALFVFGSVASGKQGPLSDLDMGVLLDKKLNRKRRFAKHLDLAGKFTRLLRTDEIDIIILNDAPLRFVRKVLSTGKLLFERDRTALVDLYDETTKMFLDFRYFLDEYNQTFLAGVGYHG